ncbi:MAG TPA: hypothetical protein VIG64_08470 [Actinomycetota bacterium]|jgi:hypothetical protein
MTAARVPERWTLEWWGPRLKIALCVTLVLIPIGLFLLGATMDARPSPCTDQQPHRELTEEVEEPATLNMRKGQMTVISFGRDLDTKRLTVPLEVVSGELADRTNPLMRVIAEFQRSGEDDGAQLSPKRIFVTAKGRGNLVRVRVCVERGDLVSGSGGEAVPAPDPGTYEGSVSFVDKRVEPFTLPLTIKLAYPRWPNVALLLYGVILAGSFYVWVLRRESTDEVVLSANGFREFFRWCAKWNGLFAVVGGSAAAITAFGATYLSSPDWGSGVMQALSLIGAMFTAFVTAASALAKKSVERETETVTEDATEDATDPAAYGR